MLFSELRAKEVINIRDCKRLGRVSDFEFDECNGCIHKLIVPGEPNKLLSFFKCDHGDYIIPYKNIKQIGPDIILVDICT